MRDRRSYVNRIRIAAVLLSAVLTLGYLAGCGSHEDTSEQAAIEGTAQPETSEWFYSQFDTELRSAYDAFRSSAEEPFDTELTEIRAEDGSPLMLTVSDLDTVYQGFVYDHPELFWLGSTYQYRVSGDGEELTADAVAVTPDADSAEQRREQSEACEKAAEQILSETAGEKGLSQERIASLIYEHLAANTSYREEALYDPSLTKEHTAYGAIVQHSAVCDGLALAYKYLLDHFGIPCIVVPGEINGAAHVWNTCFWDDRWHEMDLTWDISSGTSGEAEYFDLTTDEMGRDHIRESEGIAAMIPISSK